MRPSRRATISVLLLACLTWSSAPASALEPTSGVTDLVKDLDQILSDARLTPAQAGVIVKSAATGEQLYAQDAGKLLTPASNAKLLTSAAAIDALGLDFRFTTSVLSTGRKAGSTLAGDLYLKGTGDPTMLAADYDALAAQVADAGIKTVAGKLVADDTWFDAVRLGTDWAWDDEPYYYAAQISALTASPDTDYDAGIGDRLGRPRERRRQARQGVHHPRDRLPEDRQPRDHRRPTTNVLGRAAARHQHRPDHGHGRGRRTTSGSPWTTPPATPPRSSARR